MPYADKEYSDYYHRCRMRTVRHGNWRQWYVNCGGMCVGRLEDGSICGELDGLEFHEQFGEDHNGEGRMQVRVLLCNKCHAAEEKKRGTCTVNPRRYPSMLQQDIETEIVECGGYQNWLKKYGLVDRYQPANIEERRELVNGILEHR